MHRLAALVLLALSAGLTLATGANALSKVYMPTPNALTAAHKRP